MRFHSPPRHGVCMCTLLLTAVARMMHLTLLSSKPAASPLHCTRGCSHCSCHCDAVRPTVTVSPHCDTVSACATMRRPTVCVSVTQVRGGGRRPRARGQARDRHDPDPVPRHVRGSGCHQGSHSAIHAWSPYCHGSIMVQTALMHMVSLPTACACRARFISLLAVLGWFS